VPCLNENRAKELEEYLNKHPDFMKTGDGYRYFDDVSSKFVIKVGSRLGHMHFYIWGELRLTYKSLFTFQIFFPEVKDLYNEKDIKDLLSRMKGFSEIADVIREYEVPVVGHNMALDLLYFIKMLACDLPGETICNETVGRH